jgi:ketosteroid isomerase-like protein
VRQIKAITREFVEGFNSGDLNRVMRAYADNYIDVNLRRPRQTNAERREYYQKIITSGKVKVEVIPDEIIITGKHAIVRGTILLSRTEAGNEKPRELRYIEVFQKFSNGWKSIWGIDADIYPDQD